MHNEVNLKNELDAVASRVLDDIQARPCDSLAPIFNLTAMQARLIPPLSNLEHIRDTMNSGLSSADDAIATRCMDSSLI
jgi:hypothetical protein